MTCGRGHVNSAVDGQPGGFAYESMNNEPKCDQVRFAVILFASENVTHGLLVYFMFYSYHVRGSTQINVGLQVV